MRKRYLIIFAALVVATLSLGALVGCGGGATSTAAAGKYTLTQVSVNGMTVEGSDLSSVLTPTDYYVEIVDSKNINFEFGSYSGGVISTTYTQSGNTITVSDSSGTLNLTLDGDTISLSLDTDGQTQGMVFTKQ
ncbi:MAG: hypothetical protein FWF30_00900 [Coriobacteriia bacterium]|nr:hypothetical protein [Coriobacteriia bacterium]